MAPLHLRLLGAPEVWCGPQQVHFSTRKVLALLVYLAVEGGAHTREQLMAFLWPDSDGERGRTALRTTLARLRSAIGEVPSPVLLTRADTVAVDSAAIELDLAAVHRAWEIARGGRHGPLDLAALRAATDLCRGDFLAGFSLPDAPDFDDWASTHREAWHQRMNLIFDRVAHLQFERGDLHAAIDTAGRWVAFYPLDEAAHRMRMLTLFTTGDRTGAMAAFARCRTILQSELNAEPAPETVTLAERLRHESPPRREEVPEDVAPVVPMVGRGSEHADLVMAYRRSLRGEPRIITLEGEPGIGKTRLGREFLHWAEAQGATTLLGSALETQDVLPYHPLAQAVRGHLRHHKDLHPDLSEVWVAELGRLIPEIGDVVGHVPAGGGEERTRLSEAFGQFGLALARRRPVVWMLDDLQWADAATLDTLQYAMHTWAEQRASVLLVLALRSDDAGTSALDGWLTHMARLAPLSRLQVPLLGTLEAQLIVQTLAPDANEEVRTHILNRAGGHPLFIIESVRSSLDGEGLDENLPRGVQAVIEGRLARLSPAARTVVTAAAVLGHDIAFEPLRRVGGIAEDEALDACEEAGRRRLLLERGDVYVFPHDRIREVAYRSAGVARRRVFHRRALEVLQQVGASASVLSRHARAANLPAPAFDLTLAAADDALRVYAVRDAIALYRQAQELMPAAGEIPLDRRRRLAEQLGRACELAGEIAGARIEYEGMLATAQQAGDAAMECAALNRLAHVATLARPDLPLALTLLRRARGVAADGDDRRGLVETLCRISQIQFYTFELDGALDAGLRALQEAQALGDEALLARVYNGLAYVAMGLGHWREVDRYGREARARYAGMGDRTGEADSMFLLAEARIHWSRPLEAVALCRQAMGIHDEIGSPLADFSGTLTMVYALLDCGNVEEALYWGEHGLRHARSFGIPPHLVFTLCALGAARRAAGDFEHARELHREALALSAHVPTPPFPEIAASEACADCVRAGDWEAAAVYARAALEARSSPWPHYTGRTRWLETAALLRAGEEARAEADTQVFAARLDGDLRYQISNLFAASVVACWKGDAGRAVQLQEEGERLAQHHGIRLEPLCSPA